MATFSSIRPGKILGRNTLDRPVLTPANSNVFNNSIKPIIAAKKQLISSIQYNVLKPIIDLVDINPLKGLIVDSTKSFSPRLMNWVEPYIIAGQRKTLFYTEVNSGLVVGDRVFIIGGLYDSNSLIEQDKYKKGRDGYKVLYIDRCKVVLDIDFTGDLPYLEQIPDEFINVQYISKEPDFISINRQFTTKGGTFSYKWSLNNENVIFTNVDFTNPNLQSGFGANPGLTGSPGFYVRDDEDFLGNGRYTWINVTNTILSGSFSLISNRGISKLKINGKSFEVSGQQFREGYIYKYVTGVTGSQWVTDTSYIRPVISKANFRSGNFKGKFNSGLYGTPNKSIKWKEPEAIFKSGSIINTHWTKGEINSDFTLSESFTTEIDELGFPYQKSTGLNNNGRGYNFIFDSEIETSIIKNSSVYSVVFGTESNQFSAVEDYILGTTSQFSNKIEGGYFENCRFYNSSVTNSELKKSNLQNTQILSSKSINSNFTDSTFVDSNYISDLIIKISDYDEFLISEKRALASTFSQSNEATHKVYKFYLDYQSWSRLKFTQTFYFKDLKINNGSDELLNFFNKRFRISSWTEFSDFFYSSSDPDILNLPTIGNTINQISTDTFYKRGQQISCFLSTPEDNSYQFTSVYTTPTSGYYTKILATNSKSGYSLDIVVDTRDTFGNLIRDIDFNYDSNSSPNTNSSTFSSLFLGNKIDFSNAYIVESAFDSGLFEKSDWTSGDNINPQFDTNISQYSISGGDYNLSVITASSILVATVSSQLNNYEDFNLVNSVGNVVFLNSVYYDTSGRVDGLFVSTGGSGYTSSGPLSITQSNISSGLQINIIAATYGEVYSFQTWIPGPPPTTGVVSNIIGVFGTFSGSGYPGPSGIYTTSGGSGTGLTVLATIGFGVLAGKVTSVTLVNGGSGYTAGDWITIDGSPTPAYIQIFSVSVGDVISAQIVSGGKKYSVGDVFTIPGGNGDAQITISSVFGNLVRLPNAWKIIQNTGNGELLLQQVATNSVSLGPYADGDFYTTNSRWSYLHKTMFYKSKIKSGVFRRSYFYESLIEDSTYDVTDIDFLNIDKVKKLLISDTVFKDDKNILSKALYLRSNFNPGNDIWNDGIIYQSVWNGGTFSQGVVKDSNWVNGQFNSGVFYKGGSFNGNPGINSPTYDSNNIYSYWKSGVTTATVSNNRHSWKRGTFLDGEFVKSDWETGLFSSGSFYNSKWYSGTFSNGVIGRENIPTSYTKFYNGVIKFATVNNAHIIASDTSLFGLSQSAILWEDGIFNSGIFKTDTLQSTSHTAVWKKGTFNGGDFDSDAVWENGVFNGGKFLSSYNWQNSTPNINNLSNNQSDWAWQDGIFNGGQFGNGTLGTNSTWWRGEFNGGKFIGRVWNNGIFRKGELLGGSTWSAVGGYNPDGMTESNANNFVQSFNTDFWGLWRDGLVSNVIDDFVKDRKVFDKTLSTRDRSRPENIAKIKDTLWLGGTFNHPRAVMENSVWLDGNFRIGTFNRSSFNPFVVRPGSASQSFKLGDDLSLGNGPCIWLNGNLENSDFYISQWRSGNFISGTAFGMVWKNGISNYMNAYNVFWENGTWRNGNWYGSYFQFDGNLDSPFNRQILLRGMNYTGTSSLHIWNVFTENTVSSKLLVSATASAPATSQLVSVAPPSIGLPGSGSGLLGP